MIGLLFLACQLLSTSSAYTLNPASHSAVSSPPPSKDPFYTAPKEFRAARPGEILRVRHAPGNTVTTAPGSLHAYNILYRTTDSRYKPSWAVTTLFTPSNASTDALLSYQIAYDSVDVDASPSYTLQASSYADISTALDLGWFVAVPDYEGPLASYTAGVQAGHATLDSLRAARTFAQGLSLHGNARLATRGYSGGAMAGERAAEPQQQYAPELLISGTAVGGLTPNTTNVVLTVDGTIEAFLVPAGLIGITSQDPPGRRFLKSSLKKTGPYNATTFNSVTSLNLTEAMATFANQTIFDYFVQGEAALRSRELTSISQVDGQMGYHGVPQMPIFAYKAVHDEVSPVGDTDTLVERCCGVGARIQYQRNSVGGHVADQYNGKAAALNFLKQVLGGNYTLSGCKVENVTISLDPSPF